MFRKPAFPADLMVKKAADAARTSKVGALKANYGSVFVGDGLEQGQSQEFSFFGSTSNAFDLFGAAENLDYGIVDADGDVVVPKKGALRTLGNKKTPGIGVDFAARAFNDLRDNFAPDERGNRKSIKIEGTLYEGMNVVRSYTDLDSEHSKILEDLYTGFMAPHLRQEKRDHNIKSFHDFLKYFLFDFYPNVMLAEGIMLARSNFAISRKCTRLISGMIFEISIQSHNGDYDKYQEFLASNKYDVIKDGAANFGFMIDRNAPWRFVANLNSPRMLKYIRGEYTVNGEDIATRLKSNGMPLDASDIFPFYYDKVYTRDINMIKEIVVNLYNHHVGRREYTTTPVVQSCNVSNPEEYRVISSVSFRDSYSIGKLNSDYSSDFWLCEYLRIRLAEIGLKLNDERFLKQKSKIMNINKYISYEQALIYINSYVKGFGKSLTSGNISVIRKDAFNKARQPQVTAKSKIIEAPEVG